MNVFAISHYAPPQLTPQAIQIGRQLYHLDAKVSLLHSRDPQFTDGYDQYPDFYQGIRALDVPNPGPWLRGLAHRAALRLLPLYGTCPDLLGRWRGAAYRRALQDIAAARPDALASFGMPMSDHLLALRVKRATGLPWLAHFSDPWSDNPFHAGSAWDHWRNRALERRVIQAADQVVFTSQRTLSLVMAKYPDSWRAKCAVLPHAWDMEHFGAPEIVRDDQDDRTGTRTIVRHIGACYGTRSPLPLFGALAAMLADDPHAFEGVQFEFVGYVSPAFLASPEYKGLPPGLVALRGQVGYRASLLLAQQSDALLVIDAPSVQPSVFLPSKLVEYIGVRRPVWGITPPGTSADLITEWGGDPAACADPGDAPGIRRMLARGLALLAAAPRQAAFGNDDVYRRFAPATVAAGLKAQLQAAVRNCQAAP